MKLHRSLSALAVGASLIGGTVLGATAFGPILAGAETGTETGVEATTENVAFAADAPEAARERLAEVLGDLVTNGTITQTQLDAVIDTMVENGPIGRAGHRHEIRTEVAETTAGALGIEVETLRERLQGGETVADIASAEGVDVDSVIATLVAEAEARIDQAVTDGKLTAEEADAKKAELTDRITARVNGERPERPESAEGTDDGFPGRRGPRGPGAPGGPGAPAQDGASA